MKRCSAYRSTHCATLFASVFFPAVIGYHYNSVYPLRLIASIMIVLGAVIRLGYFNVMEEERQRNTTENRKRI